MKQTSFSSTPTILANIEVHTRMASEYDASEPHFRPENQQGVRTVLEEIAQRSGGGRLLDLGCGTGFVINLAWDLFERIDGIDVTRAMLDHVETSGRNITLHEGAAEHLPFDDATFDAASSYAFLHHVEDHRAILRETYRVLKPGGILYIDLEPNKLFWQSMVDLERRGGTYSDIVSREIESVLHTDEAVEHGFGIDAQIFRDAEPIKSVHGGFDPDSFSRDAADAGFASCEVRPIWYLGQGAVLHGQSSEAANTVDAYLRRTLPLTAHLFKYLRMICIK